VSRFQGRLLSRKTDVPGLSPARACGACFDPVLCSPEVCVSRSRSWAGVVRLLLLALAGAAQAAGAVAVGALAPDFALPAWQGSNVRLSEYRGQVVVLVFWSSRCAVCATQLAELDRLQRTYGSAGLVTLAVSVDDDMQRARDYAREHAASVPLLLDERRAVGRAFGVDRLPTTLLIDRVGRVRQLYRDLRRIDNSYISQLRALLDDAPTGDRPKP
jgi:peroxiredoxin